jgi:hypothetical protein
MVQSGNGQSGGGASLEQLPYYREYVDQILKPRVGKIIEDVKASLTERVWGEVLHRMAREQGTSADPAALEQLRVLLEDGLKLRMTAHVVADFAGGPSASPIPAQVMQAAGASADVRENVEVIEGGFPNNPLARAVGGVRRAQR